MEEKKVTKISLSTFFLILSILIIIVMAYFIYKINNEKNIETQKVANLNNEVNSLQSTVNNLNEKINDVSNIVNSPNNDNTISNNSINTNNSNIINNTSNNASSSKYIEMTEANYKKYNTSPYSFRIKEMIDNNNGTITIKGRVYKEIDLLSITKEQYDNLVNGKTINLLGYQMKANKDEDPDNGGYDMLITSTGDKWMKFYVEKNSDGSGKLHWYTESEMYDGTPFQEGETGRFIGTDTYMQITLDKSLQCKWGNDSKTLQKEYNDRKSNGTLNIKDEDDTMLPLANDEFIFKNGQCTSIIFSNV